MTGPPQITRYLNPCLYPDSRSSLLSAPWSTLSDLSPASWPGPSIFRPALLDLGKVISSGPSSLSTPQPSKAAPSTVRTALTTSARPEKSLGAVQLLASPSFFRLLDRPFIVHFPLTSLFVEPHLAFGHAAHRPGRLETPPIACALNSARRHCHTIPIPWLLPFQLNHVSAIFLTDNLDQESLPN